MLFPVRTLARCLKKRTLPNVVINIEIYLLGTSASTSTKIEPLDQRRKNHLLQLRAFRGLSLQINGVRALICRFPNERDYIMVSSLLKTGALMEPFYRLEGDLSPSLSLSLSVLQTNISRLSTSLSLVNIYSPSRHV